MKQILLVFAIACLPAYLFAQQEEESQDTSWKNTYRGSYERINDLVHTKLDVRFDYDKSYLYGKEWVTLKPHFYPTDSLLLDAKGMDIKELSLVKGTAKLPLKYTYDGLQLNVKLDKSYTRNDSYTLYIDYVSKPNELKTRGSAAITDAKGLYFINPKGEEPGKPTQIWTQGETEANSVWFVTIDKPNQKTTEEIAMTVPAKYVTLSNGLLKTQKKNADGTRTDYWNMDLPHAPYLFFMGVGEFSVIKDVPFKGKEISYYVEKEYAPYAKGIFGHTPEMIKFYSEKLGVDYPWGKYAQIVGRDYVSGAMENTTATLHQDGAYQNSRELADGNAWEETIAHELFHQWFGDLVTAESWSNLTVNESFANYSEYLWDEYKYGKDFADDHNYDDMQGYIMSGSEKKELVRFHYADKEDMFDAVSYNKGGRILHMLRNFVGDDAFYKSLNNYLTTNKFKSGEAGQLRLAFEEVTGKDLNWFWNQWYYGSGHPKLKISYNYDVPGMAKVIIEQTQGGKLFTLPVAVDIYNGTNKQRQNIWIQNKVDSFLFPYTAKPDLINVDAEKTLLVEKTDNKSEANFIAQWKYAKNYLDRKEALDFFAKKSMPEIAKGLNDKFAGLRQYTIQKIAATPYKTDAVVLETIENIAKNDRDKKTKAAAISFLVKNGSAKYLPIYQQMVNDSSYTVAGAALKGLVALDAANAYSIAKKYSNDAKGALSTAILDVLFVQGTEADFDIIAAAYKGAPTSQEKIMMTDKFGTYLVKVSDMARLKSGINAMVDFRNSIPAQYRMYTDPAFKASFDKLSKAKGKEIEGYINSVFKD
jgi:aminopeptidase N